MTSTCVRYTTAGVLDTTFANNGRARLRPALDGGPSPRERRRSWPMSTAAGGSWSAPGRHGRRHTRPGRSSPLFGLVPEPPADTVGPEVTITTPIDGATYLSTDAIVVDFSCADVGQRHRLLQRSRANGILVRPVARAAARSPSYGTDLAGNSSSTDRQLHRAGRGVERRRRGRQRGDRRRQRLYVNDKLDTRVTTPERGRGDDRRAPGHGSPAGYELLGWRPTSRRRRRRPRSPLRLTFWLQLALGALDANTVQVFRNGALGAAVRRPAERGRRSRSLRGRPQVVHGFGTPGSTSSRRRPARGRSGGCSTPRRRAIAIASPVDGAHFTLGQVVTADYACADAGSGVASCAGPVAAVEHIDTATAGTKPFTVTSADAAGNPSSDDHTYEVLAGQRDGDGDRPGHRHAPIRAGSVPRRRSRCRPASTSPAARPASSAWPPRRRAAAGGYVALPTAVDTAGPAATGRRPPAHA